MKKQNGKYKPLPTVYYPFFERKNWRYCYRISNGDWIIKDFVSLPEVLSFCKRQAKYGTPFRCQPRNPGNLLGTEFALILNLFYKRLSDRCEKVTDSPKASYGGKK